MMKKNKAGIWRYDATRGWYCIKIDEPKKNEDKESELLFEDKLSILSGTIATISVVVMIGSQLLWPMDNGGFNPIGFTMAFIFVCSALTFFIVEFFRLLDSLDK